MITAVSLAQTAVSISTSLRSQTWQHLADEATQAGVSYATSCLKKNGTTYWTSSLTPQTSCTGTAGSGSNYIEQNSQYTSTFAVTPPNTSGSHPKATVTGTVTLADSTKQYVAKGTVIVNLTSTGPNSPNTVTTLPASPTSGDEVYLQVTSPINGAILWHLKYNGTTWDFLGGPPLVLKSGAYSSQYNISSPGASSVNLLYGFTAPKPGSYKISYSATVYWSSTGNNTTFALGPCPSTSSFAPPTYSYAQGTDTYGPSLSGSVITGLSTSNYYLCYTQWSVRNGLSLTGVYLDLLPVKINP